MIPDTHPEAIRFAEACWQWLRREIVSEPDPAAFGLDPDYGEAIARQCHIEFERGVKAKTDRAREQVSGGSRLHELAL